MQTIRQHIILKISVITLVIALVAPVAVKFTHIFEDHKHEVCLDNSSTHLHEFDIDCEFYNFNLNTQYTFAYNYSGLIPTQSNYKAIFSHYTYLSKFQNLHFSRRGPPVLV